MCWQLLSGPPYTSKIMGGTYGKHKHHLKHLKKSNNFSASKAQKRRRFLKEIHVCKEINEDNAFLKQRGRKKCIHKIFN